METNANSSPNDEPENDAQATDPRFQRIQDLLADSLQKPDSLEANLGATNAGALMVATRFEKYLLEALNVPPDTLAEFDEMSPRVDSYGRMIKHVETISTLLIKLRNAVK